MLKNYILITWRNLQRSKVFSLINIAGLSIGLTACILIFLYLRTELSYDKHWKNADRIVRINWTETSNGVSDPYGTSAFGLGPELQQRLPEVEAFTRVFSWGGHTFSYGNSYFNEADLFAADTNFLSMFDLSLLYGDPRTCLKEPYSIVVTHSMAVKYFGDINPVGKVLQCTEHPYKVTGVLSDHQKPSHLKPNALLSIDYGHEAIKDMAASFFEIDTYTFIKIRENCSIARFDQKLKQWYNTFLDPARRKEDIIYTIDLSSGPVSGIHFDDRFMDEFKKTNKTYVYVFACISLFILIIACFNYMNLSTARATRRAREVGLRKVVGASRPQLVRQFLGESLVLSCIALVFSFVLLASLLPYFNTLTEQQITLSASLKSTWFWVTALSLITFISLVGGSYPALYLSAFKPSQIFRGNVLPSKISGRSGNAGLRKVLVTLQFSISIAVIIGTIIVHKQLTTMRSKDLGFNKEQVLLLDVPVLDSTGSKQLGVFKQRLASHSSIKKIAIGNQDVGVAGNLLFTAKENGRSRQASMNINRGDQDYLDLLGVKFKEGRNFSGSNPADRKNFIVNESAVKFLGLSDPLNAELSLDGEHYGKIVGVVRDYNYRSPHKKIDPLVIGYSRRSWNSIVFIKLAPQNIPASIDRISKEWKALFPQIPMDYGFLDEAFDLQYQRDDTLSKLFTCFSILTIFISCLGLFGLASFSTEQRTKEIGIRKVLGASVRSIVYLMSKDFLALVLIAMAVSAPLAWYFGNAWLQNFDYRTGISLWIFIAAGAGALVVAFLTIGTQAFKAAQTNPVNSLRSE